MDFSGLRMDYEASLKDRDLVLENKQRLNLSQRAYDTMMADIDVLRIREDHGLTTRGIPSEFINRVFSCFREAAHASVAQMLENYREELRETFQGIPEGAERLEMETRLLERRKAELIAEAEGRLKDKAQGMSFRLNRENIEYLVSDEGQAEAEFYRDRIGSYFKAVMEEYACLPSYQREQLCYRKTVDETTLAVENRRTLSLTMRSRHMDGGVLRHNIIYMKPLGIRHDLEYRYNYLVGMVCFEKGGEWSIGSIRLSSVKEATQLQRGGVLSKAEKAELEAAIQDRGVQFLASQTEKQTVVVAFTPNGLKLYRKLLHLRPLHKAQRSELVFEFECMPFQAKTYFFKFGRDAKILEPQWLADQFVQGYEQALERYADQTARFECPACRAGTYIFKDEKSDQPLPEPEELGRQLAQACRAGAEPEEQKK